MENFGKKDSDRRYGTTILIASSRARVRQDWSRALRSSFAVGEVSERTELERRMANDKPTLLLLDLALPRLGRGLSVLQRLSPSTKVILLAGTYDDGEAMKAIKAGAKGYCNKRIESSLLRVPVIGRCCLGCLLFLALAALKVRGCSRLVAWGTVGIGEISW